MPRGWEWDETLFRGNARSYECGRLPYPPGLADAIAAALGLDGRGRLLDVGCGPGTIALRLAPLFAEVVGLDADADMLAAASPSGLFAEQTRDAEVRVWRKARS